VREVLVRALRALCDSGAIRRVGRSRFAVTDQRRLRELARARGEAVSGEAVSG
jgi:diketogulonate reductase-like aldo/keto reductase